MKPIKILATGGTIDKIYFDAKSDYQIGEPCVDELLKDVSFNVQYDVESILKKDSLEIDDADRAYILNAVRNCKEDKIIITHGTDTMVQTAQTLSIITDKTIVLTGAMQPAIFKNSDAAFNLGCAFAAVQTLKHGIYITMSAAVFSYDNVRKNLEAGAFQTLTD